MKYIYLLLILSIFNLVLVSAEDFTLSVPVIKEQITDEVSIGRYVTVYNNLDGDQKMSLEYNNEIVKIKENDFTLRPKELKVVELVLGNKDLEEGVYVGNLLFKGNKIEKIVPIILEVESEKVKFDTSIDTNKINNIYPGNVLNVDLSVHNLGSLNKEVDIEYRIIDLDGGIVLEDYRNYTVSDKSDFSENFQLPNNIKLGDYIFMVLSSQDDSVGTSSFLFTVSKEEKKLFQFNEKMLYYFYLITLIVVIIFVFIYYRKIIFKKFFKFRIYFISRKTFKKNRRKKKIKNKKVNKIQISLPKAQRKIRKLTYQKDLLNRGYKEGLLREEVYILSIKRINEAIDYYRKKLL